MILEAVPAPLGKLAADAVKVPVIGIVEAVVATLYYLRAPLRTGGDEYDVAVYLGVPKALIEVPLALAFLACLYLGLRILPSWHIRRMWLGTILVGSIITGVSMALFDPILITQVDARNPWFQPVLGYSLPVLFVNIFALIGIWIWYRFQRDMQIGESNE